MKNNSKIGSFLLIVLIAVLIGGGVYFGLPLLQGDSLPVDGAGVQYDISSMNVTASNEAADGIPTEARFTLTSEDSLTDAEIRSIVKIEPQTEVEISGSSGSYEIKPVEHLSAGSLYNISLTDGTSTRSFAFQTKNEFALKSAIPGDMAMDVPVNAGIELTFTNPNIVNLAESLTVTPSVEGEFARYGDRWVLIPSAPLAYDTIYEIEIAKTLETVSGDILPEGISLTFRTEENRLEAVPLDLASYEPESFTGDRAPVIEFSQNYYSDAWDNYLEEFKQNDFTVDIQKFKDSASYGSALEAFDNFQKELNSPKNFRVDEELLSPYASAETKMTVTDEWAPLYIVMPAPLEAGQYAVTVSGYVHGDYVEWQKLIQVSDMAVFAINYEGGSTVWVNDPISGEPMVGASIFKNGYSVASTGEDGIATFTTEGVADGEFAAITVQSGNVEYIYAENAITAPEETSASHKYMGAMYSDRGTYLSTDTINVWGTLVARKGEMLENEFTLRLQSPAVYYSGDTTDYPPIFESTVTLDDMGTFTAEVPIENLSSTYYTLELSSGDEVILSRNIEIQDYTKPLYILDITQDEPFHTTGESITLDFSLTLYDGTPMKDYEIMVEHSTSYGSPYKTGNSIYTDESGKASYSFTLADDVTHWHLSTFSVKATAAGLEDYVLTEYETIYLMPRTVMLEAEYDDTLNVVDIMAHEIDTSEIEAEFEASKGSSNRNVIVNKLYDPDNFRGDKYTSTAHVSVIKTTWTETISDSHYDPIENVTTYEYVYDSSEEIVDTAVVAIVDGIAQFDTSPYVAEEFVSYSLDVEIFDIKGRTVKMGYPINISGTSYTMYNSMPGDVMYNIIVDGYEYDYDIGESVNLMIYNSLEVRSGYQTDEGRSVFLVMQEGLSRIITTNGNTAKMTFTEQDVPNVVVYGAYFDGKNIHMAQYYMGAPSYQYLRYTGESSELNIEIKTDKTEYAPGDTVRAEVSVTDKNGIPRPATLLLSVVDEAAFAVDPNYFDLLGKIYGSVWFPRVDTHVSYIHHNENFIGGEGGGGDEASSGIRDDFSDNPAFVTIKTDQSGIGSTSFTLADSVTSWRITALAVGEKEIGIGPLAGQKEVNVTSTLPFFADILHSDRYLSSDDISVSLRSFGSELTVDDSVSYAAELIGGGNSVTKTISAHGYSDAILNFGKMEAGTYTLNVSALWGDVSDALEIKFEVVDNLSSAYMSKEVTATGLATIESLSYPVVLTFADNDNSAYYSALHFLAGEHSGRSDKNVAAWYAGNMLLEHYDGVYKEPVKPTVNSSTSGVMLFPYSKGDVKLTALMAATAPDFFSSSDLAGSLYNVLNDDKSTADQVAYAYMGLAALREPVLLEVRNFAANPTGLEEEQLLVLGTALLLVGDDSGAAALYNDIISPKLIREGSYTHYEGADRDETVSMTALALMLSSTATDRTDANGMLSYLMQNKGETVAVNLEMLYYLQKIGAPMSGANSVTMNIEGSDVDIPMENGLGSIPLSKSQLESATVALPEGITIMAKYEGVPTTTDDNLSIVKSFSTDSAEEVSLLGEFVTFTLDAKVEGDLYDGSYTITDTLPANMRFISLAEGDNYSNRWHLVSEDGDTLTFRFYVGYEDGFDGIVPPISYTARVVLDGNYKVPSATIINETSGGIAISETDVFSSNLSE